MVPMAAKVAAVARPFWHLFRKGSLLRFGPADPAFPHPAVAGVRLEDRRRQPAGRQHEVL